MRRSKRVSIIFVFRKNKYQRTNGPVNAHLISGPTVSTKTSKIGQGLIMVIYIYTAPGQGQTTPLRSIFSVTVLFSQYSPLLQVFLN